MSNMGLPSLILSSFDWRLASVHPSLFSFPASKRLSTCPESVLKWKMIRPLIFVFCDLPWMLFDKGPSAEHSKLELEGGRRCYLPGRAEGRLHCPELSGSGPVHHAGQPLLHEVLHRGNGEDKMNPARLRLSLTAWCYLSISNRLLINAFGKPASFFYWNTLPKYSL